MIQVTSQLSNLTSEPSSFRKHYVLYMQYIYVLQSEKGSEQISCSGKLSSSGAANGCNKDPGVTWVSFIVARRSKASRTGTRSDSRVEAILC